MMNVKKVFRAVVLVLITFFSFKTGLAQPISNHYFGQNAWMPDTIGTTVYGGKLHKTWGSIALSKASIIRFGGIAPDKSMPTNFQYIKMIDSIRAKGMEPVMEVPYDKGNYTAQQAAAIVQYINVTRGKNVKYWVIGNEPDLGYAYTTAAQVAGYFKPFASAMKAVDPSILTVGPETAWFDQNIINGLTTPNGPDDITGKDGNGRYYLDVISFHHYGFDGTQTRPQVISKLTQTGGLQDNLAYLNGRLATCNTTHGRSGSSVIKVAITEANINWQNSASDNLNGLGSNSFIGAQYVAEMFGVGMKNGVDFINIWSVIEGNNTALNIGYLDASTMAKKPLFYHFKMMAENFKGNFATGTTNQANVKACGSFNGQFINVLLMNQDLSNNFNYTVKLNSGTVSGNNTLKVNVNAGVNVEYSEVIPAQSTILLTFNSAGQIIKKTEYTLANHALTNLPPSETFYTATGVAAQDGADGDIKNFEMKLFPNPTSSKLTIQMNKLNTLEKKLEIEMFDMMGRQVYTKSSNFLRGREELDLSTALADGTYLLRLTEEGDKDNFRVEKIIVVR